MLEWSTPRPSPTGMERSLPRTIIAADWGRSVKKRRAVKVNLETSKVERLPAGTTESLEALLAAGSGSTLVGIDAVFGVPEYVGRAAGSTGFLDWLAHGQNDAKFFEAAVSPEDWSPWRPFWKNPCGKGSQKRFFDAIRVSHSTFPEDHGLRRKIDRWVGGKAPTCVSGMPGTVGFGTLELWKELAGGNGLVVWPFAGADLPSLLTGEVPVVVEAYPALCYGIVLAESLPTGRVPVAKTNPAARATVLERLTRSPAWEPRLRIADDLWSAAHECEDDFDALFLGLGLYRLALEGQLNPGGSALGPALDPAFEGGIVGSWCVTPQSGSVPRRSRPLDVTRLTCPVAGCQHIFKMGRGGWDAHIASARTHPGWHPEVRDGAARKVLFRSEFPEFFRQ